MKTSSELELEYQLRRRTNPQESEEESRMLMFKLAQKDALTDLLPEMDQENHCAVRRAIGQIR